MKPSELSLFSPKEQSLLVSTERARLAELSEDELADLLVVVRRARNKYSKLHRRQSSATVDSAGKRYAATTSNTRTLRKAEIFEDTLARVSQALARAAKVSADELKRERLAMAQGERDAAAPARSAGRTQQRRPAADRAATSRRRSSGGPVTPKRAASTTAANARHQAKRDAR